MPSGRRSTTAAIPAAIARPRQRVGEGAERIAARHQVGGGEIGAATGQDQQIGQPVPGRKAGELLDRIAHGAVAGEDGDMTLAPGQDAVQRRRHVMAHLDPDDLGAGGRGKRAGTIG